MTDKIMGLLALAFLSYCWGCCNRNLTGPADIWRDVRAGHAEYGWQGWTGVWTDIMSGHRNRRSDTVDTPDVPDPENVLSNVHPDDGPDRVIADGVATVGPPHRPWHGIPAAAVHAVHADRDGRDDAKPAKYTVSDRRAWVAARLQSDDSMGLSPMEIYAMGAEIFDCSEKTIQRDREALLARKGTR